MIEKITLVMFGICIGILISIAICYWINVDWYKDMMKLNDMWLKECLELNDSWYKHCNHIVNECEKTTTTEDEEC